MPSDRREFLHLAAGGFAASVLLSLLESQATTHRQIKALAFDAFTILDPRPVFALLEYVFEHVLSTDKIRTYRPDPRACRMAIDAFGLKCEEITFVAFAGWEAAGAKWFSGTPRSG
jgi:2-haloacid dehalogenase